MSVRVQEWILSGALLFPLVVIVTSLAASWLSERPVSEFTRDLAAVAGVPPWLGLLSQVGNILWWASASIAALGAMQLADSRRIDARHFLWLFAGLTLLLAADDTFMVHERLAPRFLGLHELVLVSLYGALLAYMLIRYRTTVWQQTGRALLGLALAGFVLSVAIDTLPEDLLPLHHLFEDGSKLVGISCWLGFSVQSVLYHTALDRR
ncbi:MAG: hypothetical protein WD078_04210 [Woeseia sp.]